VPYFLDGATIYAKSFGDWIQELFSVRGTGGY